MDPKAIKELEILHEVSKSEQVNQRHLSKKLDMAAGLVNLYLRRLARKGYIKVTGIKPRRLKYLLTPHGIAEKTRLTYEFALISYKYFKSATDDMREKLKQMEQARQTQMVVYGSGESAEMCLLLIKEFDMRVVAIVDGKAESARFFGYPVVPPDLLPSLNFDKIIVAKMDGHEEVKSALKGAGIAQEKVCWLLNPST
ncbi:winged helix-turn-helix transcriptional regulator [Candidatus Poribacteria bacterium]|nr:winged helix-turn-helix transcriptional regulator [Candidatus Poribacteria bacterium]